MLRGNDPNRVKVLHGPARDAAAKIAANAVGATQLQAVYIDSEKYIRSSNYNPGVEGWSIDGDGNAELNNVTVRGTVTGSTITGSSILVAGSNRELEMNANAAELIFRYNGLTRGEIKAGDVHNKVHLSGNGLHVDNVLSVSGTVVPLADAGSSYTVGTSSLRWNEVWAVDGTINTSDPSEKADVLDSPLGLSFVRALRPVSFRWQSGTRRHFGFDADQVAAVLAGRDFAGYVDPAKRGDKGPKGLRYHEFIAPLTRAVQELAEEVDTIKKELANAGS